jgi:hypothetical protein
MDMRIFRVRVILASVALLAAGCASSEEWGTWQSNRAHFASQEHFTFSMRNRQGTDARVTREDIAVARDQGWWGRPITVGQEQILER